MKNDLILPIASIFRFISWILSFTNILLNNLISKTSSQQNVKYNNNNNNNSNNNNSSNTRNIPSTWNNWTNQGVRILQSAAPGDVLFLTFLSGVPSNFNLKTCWNCFDINIKKSATGAELLSGSLVSLVPNKKKNRVFVSICQKLRQSILIILHQRLNMYFNLINML